MAKTIPPSQKNPVATNRAGMVLLVVLLAVAAFVRLYDLDRAPFRADELNQFSAVARGQTVAEIWKNPPFNNQIPSADILAVASSTLIPGPPSEWSIRLPFALLGIATVWLCVILTLRRWGLLSALLLALWMGLNPFHVYQSREAYYYVLTIFFSTGSLFACIDAAQQHVRQGTLPLRQLAVWATWVVFACHTHMSAWVFAGVQWLVLLFYGWSSQSRRQRADHVRRLTVTALIIGLIMLRWLFRAFKEITGSGTSAQQGGHFGFDLSWVLARLGPMYVAGANWIGVLLILVVVTTAVLWVKRVWREEELFRPLSWVTGIGVTISLAYVSLIGGGVAKLTYFASCWPALLVWCSVMLAKPVTQTNSPAMRVVAISSFAVFATLISTLVMPVRAIVQLDGKPTPYKVLQHWLDETLDPGSVVVVDRWLEPWNEMAAHAPTNVTVTFTVPDEPYDQYVGLRWREVTQKAIESGTVQAFIRMTRNHEEKAGLWTWPESHFTRYARVANEGGLWLRDRGYAPTEDFYSLNSNRIVVEVFYDLREDMVQRQRDKGESFAIFFNHSMPYEKSGPMGMFPLQTQQFMDWRVLKQRGTLDVYNLTDSPKTGTIQITATSPRGTKIVTGPDGKRFQFSGSQLQRWALGPVLLQPGLNPITLEDTLWDRAMNPLMIAGVDVVAAP